MKGKLTLHMYQDPPHILFANDSFTHNQEFETMNKIGTIRDQYEWQPLGNYKFLNWFVLYILYIMLNISIYICYMFVMKIHISSFYI